MSWFGESGYVSRRVSGTQLGGKCVAFWSQITNVSIIKAWFLKLLPSFLEISITIFGMLFCLPYLKRKDYEALLLFLLLLCAILYLYLINCTLHILTRGILGTLIYLFLSILYVCYIVRNISPVICEYKSHAFF